MSLAQSIGIFKYLVDALCMHFVINRPFKKTSVALVNFQQGKWETLKEYLAHFNTLELEIKDLNEGISIHQIIARLRARHFSLSLGKKLVTSLANLLARLQKYKNAMETKMARRQVNKSQSNS